MSTDSWNRDDNKFPRLTGHGRFCLIRSFRVALQDVEIDLSGSRAEVRFLRVDTIDGQTVLHPDRKIFVLEKRANGRLLARPQ